MTREQMQLSALLGKLADRDERASLEVVVADYDDEINRLQKRIRELEQGQGEEGQGQTVRHALRNVCGVESHVVQGEEVLVLEHKSFDGAALDTHADVTLEPAESEKCGCGGEHKESVRDVLGGTIGSIVAVHEAFGAPGA